MIERLTPYLSIIKVVSVIATIVAIFAFGYHYGGKRVQTKWDAAEKNRSVAEVAAVSQRLSENAQIAAKQAETAQSIRKGYQDEISRLRASYANAGKLRVKVDCPASTMSSKSESPVGANAGASIELPAKTTASLYGIAQDADKTSAQLKALQDWIRKNGMD